MVTTDNGRNLLSIYSIDTLLIVTLIFSILSLLLITPFIIVYLSIGEDRFQAYLNKNVYLGYLVIIEILLLMTVISVIVRV